MRYLWFFMDLITFCHTFNGEIWFIFLINKGPQGFIFFLFLLSLNGRKWRDIHEWESTSVNIVKAWKLNMLLGKIYEKKKEFTRCVCVLGSGRTDWFHTPMQKYTSIYNQQYAGILIWEFIDHIIPVKTNLIRPRLYFVWSFKVKEGGNYRYSGFCQKD